MWPHPWHRASFPYIDAALVVSDDLRKRRLKSISEIKENVSIIPTLVATRVHRLPTCNLEYFNDSRISIHCVPYLFSAGGQYVRIMIAVVTTTTDQKNHSFIIALVLFRPPTRERFAPP